MITKWILEHFKSVNEKTSLEFAPLTIFAGANSSGKSTIIQSILLTTQTIQSQVHSRPVILNGHIVRLGTFDDIMSNLSESNKIFIGFELFPEFKKNMPFLSQRRYYRSYYSGDSRNLKSISCDFSFSALGKDNEKDVLQLQPKLETCILKVKGSHNENKGFEESIEIQRSPEDVSDRAKNIRVDLTSKNKIDISELEYKVISKNLISHRYRRYMGIPNTGEIAGCTLQHFLPSRFVVVYDTIEEQISQVLESLLGPENRVYYDISGEEVPDLSAEFVSCIITMLEESILEMTSIDSSDLKNHEQKRITHAQKLLEKLKNEFTPSIVRKTYQIFPVQIRREFFTRVEEKNKDLRKMLKAGRPPEYNLAYSPLSDYSDEAADFVQMFFANQVKYLGPLRDEPKPVYPLAGSVDPKDIGFKGENTAAVLEVHRNTQIYYIPCDAFSKIDHPLKAQENSLLNAVLEWLEYMGVAHDLRTFDKGKLGHELKVSTLGSNDLHDLTHVGVGVSQVLPILVQSLLSEVGSTLVFEQPELHLHPRVQTRLADFFVSMTMIGKQCIVETHSEYMINRLRYMSAIAEGDGISRNVILYFVEKDKGYSEYRPIRINKYGVIENWPHGFFDENEENAAETLKAGMLKKQREDSARKT